MAGDGEMGCDQPRHSPAYQRAFPAYNSPPSIHHFRQRNRMLRLFVCYSSSDRPVSMLASDRTADDVAVVTRGYLCVLFLDEFAATYKEITEVHFLNPCVIETSILTLSHQIRHLRENDYAKVTPIYIPLGRLGSRRHQIRSRKSRIKKACYAGANGLE
ncbi:hypothetical protein ANCCEY_13187 [Ancylostoma ceylanicum]|uniref:Uncharacterized protein n=1 Tax=Ancylostoma ceylanicum TaxID=53326 RepID=A0A0D6L9C0_9BILA|nr:hypothetical protein ANCCEY_13187 [Ancylostoma ceylanicum]